MLPSVPDFLATVLKLPYPKRIHEAAILGAQNRDDLPALKAFILELLHVNRPEIANYEPIDSTSPLLSGQQTDVAHHYDMHQLGLFAAAAGGLVDILLEYFQRIPSNLLKPLVVSELCKQATSDVLKNLISQSPKSVQFKLLHAAIHNSRFDVVDFVVTNLEFSPQELRRVLHGCTAGVVERYIDSVWVDFHKPFDREEKVFILKMARHHTSIFMQRFERVIEKAKPTNRSVLWENWLGLYGKDSLREIAPFADHIFRIYEKFPSKITVERGYLQIPYPPSHFIGPLQRHFYKKFGDRWFNIVLSSLNDRDNLRDFTSRIVTLFAHSALGSTVFSAEQYRRILDKLIPGWEAELKSASYLHDYQHECVGNTIAPILCRVKRGDIDKAIADTKERIKIESSDAGEEAGFVMQRSSRKMKKSDASAVVYFAILKSLQVSESQTITRDGFKGSKAIFYKIWDAYAEDVLKILPIETIVSGASNCGWPLEARQQTAKIIEATYAADALFDIVVAHSSLFVDKLESVDTIIHAICSATPEKLLLTIKKKTKLAHEVLLRLLKYLPVDRRLPIINELLKDVTDDVQEKLLALFDPADAEYSKTMKNRTKSQKNVESRAESWKIWFSACLNSGSSEMFKRVLKELVQRVKNDTSETRQAILEVMLSNSSRVPSASGMYGYETPNALMIVEFYRKNGVNDHAPLWEQLYSDALNFRESDARVDDLLRSFATRLCAGSVMAGKVHSDICWLGSRLGIMVWKKYHAHEPFKVEIPKNGRGVMQLEEWKKFVEILVEAIEEGKVEVDQENEGGWMEVDDVQGDGNVSEVDLDISTEKPQIHDIFLEVAAGLPNGSWIQIPHLASFAQEQLTLLQNAPKSAKSFTERGLLDFSADEPTRWAYETLSTAFKYFFDPSVTNPKKKRGKKRGLGRARAGTILPGQGAGYKQAGEDVIDFFARYAETVLESDKAYTATQYYIWHRQRGTDDPKKTTNDVVMALLDKSISAMYIPFVAKYIYRHRQDLLDGFLASDGGFCGRFTAAQEGVIPAKGGVGGSKAHGTGRRRGKGVSAPSEAGNAIKARKDRVKAAAAKYQQPVPFALPIRYNLHMLSSEQCKMLSRQLWNFVAKQDVAVVERVAAVRRWGLLPITNSVDVVEAMRSLADIPKLPPSVATQVLMSHLANDEPFAPIAYLIQSSSRRSEEGQVMFAILDHIRHVVSSEDWKGLMNVLWKLRGKLGVSLQKRLIRFYGAKDEHGDLDRVFAFATHPQTHDDVKIEGVVIALNMLSDGRAEFGFRLLRTIMDAEGVSTEVLVNVLRGKMETVLGERAELWPDSEDGHSWSPARSRLPEEDALSKFHDSLCKPDVCAGYTTRLVLYGRSFIQSDGSLYPKSFEADSKFKPLFTTFREADKIPIASVSASEYLGLLLSLLTRPELHPYVQALAMETVLKWVPCDPRRCLVVAAGFLTGFSVQSHASPSDSRYILTVEMLSVAMRMLVCAVALRPELVTEAVVVVGDLSNKLCSGPFDWRNKVYHDLLVALLSYIERGCSFWYPNEAALNREIVHQLLDHMNVPSLEQDALKTRLLSSMQERTSEEFHDRTTKFMKGLPVRYPGLPRVWQQFAEEFVEWVVSAQMHWGGFNKRVYVEFVLEEASRTETDGDYESILLFYGRALLLKQRYDMDKAQPELHSAFLEKLLRKHDPRKPQERWLEVVTILEKFVKLDKYLYASASDGRDRKGELFGKSWLTPVISRCVEVVKNIGGVDLLWIRKDASILAGGYHYAANTVEWNFVAQLLLLLPLDAFGNLLDDLWSQSDIKKASDAFNSIVSALQACTALGYTDSRLVRKDESGINRTVYNDNISYVIMEFLDWVAVREDGYRLMWSLSTASQHAHPILEECKPLRMNMALEEQGECKRYCLLKVFTQYPTLCLLLPDLFWGLVEQEVGIVMDLVCGREDMMESLRNALGKVLYPKASASEPLALFGPDMVVTIIGDRTMMGMSDGMKEFGMSLLVGLAKCLDPDLEKDKVTLDKICAVVSEAGLPCRKLYSLYGLFDVGGKGTR